MRLLVVAQNFRQGWGGVPESIRLMAGRLAEQGVSTDVFDAGALHREVGRLEVLPDGSAVAEPFPLSALPDYAAILQVGPWQKALHVRRLLSARRPDQPLYYLPRGGLARIEFARIRDLKKWPYFYAVERSFIAAADGVIFSSELEQRETITAARRRGAEHVIPDLVEPPTPVSTRADARTPGKVTFGFLAEITPRKGLLSLVEAFQDFAVASALHDNVRLVVGGAVRRGSERYFARAVAAARRAQGAPVEFRGPVRHQDREMFYGEVDVLVVASRFESFALTPLEALAEGCVVVATPNIGVLEYVESGRHLIRADGFDRASLAKALTAAHAATAQRVQGDQSARKGLATRAAQEINARALGDWLRLLSPET